MKKEMQERWMLVLVYGMDEQVAVWETRCIGVVSIFFLNNMSLLMVGSGKEYRGF